MQLQLRRTPPLLLALYIVTSFGLVLVLLAVARIFHDPIVEVDHGGLTTRKGRRFPWTDLRNAEVKAEYGRRSRPSSLPTFWRVELAFKDTTVAFGPLPYENGYEALAVIEKALGRSLGRPSTRKDPLGH